MNKANYRTILGRSGAFTLVEVVLALAVVSFGITVSVGLNAVSLTSLREARAMEVASRIFRTIHNEAQVSDYAALSALTGTFGYDFEGKPVGNPSSPDAVYRAEISTFTATVRDAAGITTLDGSTGFMVHVHQANAQSPNSLISARFSLIGNRAKSPRQESP